jgi:hypothetical protein
MTNDPEIGPQTQMAMDRLAEARQKAPSGLDSGKVDIELTEPRAVGTLLVFLIEEVVALEAIVLSLAVAVDGG